MEGDGTIPFFGLTLIWVYNQAGEAHCRFIGGNGSTDKICSKMTKKTGPGTLQGIKAVTHHRVDPEPVSTPQPGRYAAHSPPLVEAAFFAVIPVYRTRSRRVTVYVPCHYPVGADLRVCPIKMDERINLGEHIGSPLRDLGSGHGSVGATGGSPKHWFIQGMVL
jgi:hypothetical protein